MLKNEYAAPSACENLSDDALLTFVVNHLADRADRLQPADFELATPVITVLAGRVSPEMCHAAAETLRATGTIPVAVFAALAMPQITGAPQGTALAADNRHHGPGQLNAATCSVAQLLLIARQDSLPEAQTNMIVARGRAEALVAVAANPGARFAKSSLTTLVELAASDFSLREALCGRGDLPDSILDRLWPYLSARGKRSVIGAGLTLDHGAARILIEAAEQDLIAILRDGDLPLGLDTCHARISDGTMTLAEAVRILAADGRIVDVAALLSRRAGMGLQTALALLLGAYDRGCVALARAAGADIHALGEIMDVRKQAGARRTPDRRGPLHAFAAMSAAEATELAASLEELLAPPATVDGNGQEAANPDRTAARPQENAGAEIAA